MSLHVKEVDFGEQNIIYVTSEKEKSYGVEWTIPATQDLLKYLKKYLILFQKGKIKTKKQLYENISAEMEEKGMFYSGAQCENKWKTLKRRYLANYEKVFNSSNPNKRNRISTGMRTGLYESLVEEILKIERPALKKELHELQEVNLNVPPGFVKAEPGESSSESAEEAQEEEYTQNDEELVQLVLRESSSASAGDAKNNDLDTEQYPNDHMNEAEHNYSHSHSAEKDNSDNLAKEITDLKKVIKRNLQTNTEMLRNQNEIHEQMLTFLESLDKREEEKLEIKRQKLEKQGELVQQIKVQNSLIAKLIQKFGNK